MTAITQSVDLDRRGRIAVLTVNNPPVNALSQHVRQGLYDGVTRATADAAVGAVVVTCAGRTFIAGADITEFGKPPKEPGLHEVLALIEQSPKPVVAAVHGDRKSTRLNSSHTVISYAVFCLKKKITTSSPTA